MTNVLHSKEGEIHTGNVQSEREMAGENCFLGLSSHKGNV